jgi:DNA modification methylase
MNRSITDVLEGRSRWALEEATCLAVLPALPTKSVHHTITDPPYSKDLYSRTRTNKGSGFRPNGKPVCASELSEKTSALQLASMAIGSIDEILDDVARELLRLTPRWLVVFSDIEIAPRWRAAFAGFYVRTGVWVKPDAMPQITGDRPAQGFEACTIGHEPGRKRWNGGGRPAVWTHNTCKGRERPDHPCPKPLALMEQLIADFTDPGEIILDPFAGSGTTGVACLRLGRRFIGIERDEKYAQIARDRLTAEGECSTLSQYRAGQLSMFAETT